MKPFREKLLEERAIREQNFERAVDERDVRLAILTGRELNNIEVTIQELDRLMEENYEYDEDAEMHRQMSQFLDGSVSPTFTE